MMILKSDYQSTKATEFVNKRFPSGWGGCAVIFTEDQQYLISVALESFNAGAGLCMETGAMCEAQKFNLRITHSVCVSRDSENDDFKILTGLWDMSRKVSILGW